MKACIGLIACGLAVAAAQQVGPYQAEEHPPLPIQHCTKAGCVTEDNTGVVMDGSWRWLHKVGGYDACLSNNNWTCGDPVTCAQTCAYEGISRADYDNNYGVSTTGNEVTMKYSDKFSSRLFLTAGDDKYRMFKMLNQEFSFDVDTSTLDCGMNGALVFLEMQEDGGLQYPNNKAGAKYGMGCCDGQCAGVSFINGEANQNHAGLCCGEFDLWEANKAATVFTSHPSSKPLTYKCTNDCQSITDRNGCGYNTYYAGDKAFYGPGANYTVDSSKKVTVVTQFVTNDNTANGTLVDIRRLWVQNGKVFATSKFQGTNMDSITDAYCDATMGSTNTHTTKGGLKAMGEALGRGMVLCFSIWTDATGHMTWLDSGAAGPCPADSGDPAVLMKSGAALKFSNIRFGDIGTTYGGVSPPTDTPTPTPTPTPTKTTPTPTPSPTPSSSSPTPTPTTTQKGVPLYGQCGGKGYTGSTTCAQGTCVFGNDWWSMCTP